MWVLKIKKVDVGSERWTLEAKKWILEVKKWILEAKKVDIKTKKLKFTVHGNWELGSHKQVEIPEK
mgnify:CR=1 FL=1